MDKPQLTGKHKEACKAMIQRYGYEKGSEVFNAWCSEHGYSLDKKTVFSVDGSPLSFRTDSFVSSVIETKSGKNYYVTGYISTSDLDLVNDIVTPECLKDMVQQLQEKNVKLDLEHEAYTKDSTTVPLGRIIEARLDDKGVWVKAELNSHSNRFDEVWNSIKNRFIDAFSITFRPLKMIEREVNGVKARLLYSIDLLNVALTGNPAQPNAKIMEVFSKSLKTITMEKSVKSNPDSCKYCGGQLRYDDISEQLICSQCGATFDAPFGTSGREAWNKPKKKSGLTGANKMVEKKEDSEKEKEKDKEEEDEEKCKKSSTPATEVTKVEVIEQKELKSLIDAIAELKSEIASVKEAMAELKSKDEAEKLTGEVKSLTKELAEVKAKMKAPVFKAELVEAKTEPVVQIDKKTAGILGLIKG